MVCIVRVVERFEIIVGGKWRVSGRIGSATSGLGVDSDIHCDLGSI